MPLGFQKQLVPVLIRELYDLVLYRRTVTRADALDLSGIEWRLVYVRPYSVVNFFGRIANEALDLILLDTLCRKRKGHRVLVRRLRLQTIPVARTALQPRRA